jgi:hypothetical protein
VKITPAAKNVKARSGWLAAAVIFVWASVVQATPSVVTQMYDIGHSGWNRAETVLTVANVKSSFKFLFRNATDGQTYSQPLFIPGLKIGPKGSKKPHNVIFLATENNTVYAFDADTQEAPLWAENLTPSGETVQTSDDYNNTRVPQIGITGTPVIDRSTGTLYAVAASKTLAMPVVFHQRLHAIDITTGNERVGSPVDIVAKYPGTSGLQDGSGNVVFDPLAHFNRTALLLFGNRVYIAFGSHEDVPVYQGWVMAYDKSSLAQLAVLNTSPNLPAGVSGGSIWQSSMGLAADSTSVYAITANGPFDANTGGVDYGDTVLRLDANLNVTDYFTPCNQQELDDLDVDLGSGAAMIIPTQKNSPSALVTFAGKEGTVYLADRRAMGGYTPTAVPDNVPCTDNVVDKLWRVLGVTPTDGNADRSAYWGAPAYFADSAGRQYVYYSGAYAPIIEYDLANGALTLGTAPNGSSNQTPSSTYNFPHGGTIPAISSNGGDSSTAILWAIRRALPPASQDGNGPLTLDAFAATDLTNQLVFDIPAGQWNFHNNAFLIPTVVNGKVYVASGGELDVFGVGAGGAIRLSTNRLNFGRVRAGSSKTKKFSIRNVGKGDLQVTIGALSDPFQMASANGNSFTLHRGERTPISVSFSPTSGGPTSQTLTLTSDDAKHPSRTVTVLGIGR